MPRGRMPYPQVKFLISRFRRGHFPSAPAGNGRRWRSSLHDPSVAGPTPRALAAITGRIPGSLMPATGPLLNCDQRLRWRRPEGRPWRCPELSPEVIHRLSTACEPRPQASTDLEAFPQASIHRLWIARSQVRTAEIPYPQVAAAIHILRSVGCPHCPHTVHRLSTGVMHSRWITSAGHQCRLSTAGDNFCGNSCGRAHAVVGCPQARRPCE